MGGVMKAMTKLLENRLVGEFCALSVCTYFIQFALALIDVPGRLHQLLGFSLRFGTTERLTLRPDRQREDFGDQSPAHGANSICEVGNICNKSVLDDTSATVCA